jgi:hypothetical protein
MPSCTELRLAARYPDAQNLRRLQTRRFREPEILPKPQPARFTDCEMLPQSLCEAWTAPALAVNRQRVIWRTVRLQHGLADLLGEFDQLPAVLTEEQMLFYSGK